MTWPRVGRFAAVAFAAVCAMALFSSTASATFPGANGLIAFSSDLGQGKYEIATMKPDGSHVRYLTRGIGPAWSADGKRIVFMRTAPDAARSDIYVMRADGSHVRRLTFTPHRWEAGPAFSPDGRKIVFFRLAVGIIVMRLDDLRTRFVADGGISPDWAPNGKHIVFENEMGTGGGIAIIRPDGTRERQLTFPPGSYDSDIDPAYASSGHTIYFERMPWDGPCTLARIRATGGPIHRMAAPDGGCPSYPAPAPEGGCVVGGWPHPPDGSAELYALGRRCPAQGWLNQGSQPSWQSLPAAR